MAVFALRRIPNGTKQERTGATPKAPQAGCHRAGFVRPDAGLAENGQGDRCRGVVFPAGGLAGVRHHHAGDTAGLLPDDLAGLVADGLVLINTLRKIGPRISWINDAVVRVMEVGGPQLMADMMTPLLWGPDWLAANRKNFIQPGTDYQPLDKQSGTYNLLKNMGAADWEIEYEKITCPVLIVMGLNDRVFFDANVVDNLIERIPNAQRVDIKEAGHMLPIETPRPLIDSLLDFGRNL